MYKVNILFVISDLEYGGAQRQVVEAANYLDKTKYNVFVCSLSCYTPLRHKLQIPKNNIIIIKKYFKYDISVVLRLVYIIKKHKINIVHSFLFDASIAARISAKLAGVTLMIDSERNCYNKFKQIQLIAFALTKKCVDGIIANSKAGVDFNSKTLKMPKEVYKVVYNGVDVQKFTKVDTGCLKKELRLEHYTFVIGLFASFKPQKNQIMALEMASHLVKKTGNFILLFVGDELNLGMDGSSAYKTKIFHMVNRLNLEKYCRFVGNIDDTEKYYSLCNITILPSLYEGTPNVALESMSCGVPVIASDVSDNSFLIPNGKAGFVVPLNDIGMFIDKISLLMNNAILANNMSHFSRKWIIENFASNIMAKNLEKTYEDFLAEKMDKLC